MSSSIGATHNIEPFMITSVVFDDKDYKDIIISGSSTPDEYGVAIQNLHDQLIYPQLDDQSVEVLCIKLITQNLDKIKKEVDKDVYAAGVLVFNKFKDLMTSQTMEAFKKKYPDLDIPVELSQRLEKTIKVRIHWFAGLVFEEPIKKILDLKFPGKIPNDYEPDFHSKKM